jgi:hypothetical protein
MKVFVYGCLIAGEGVDKANNVRFVDLVRSRTVATHAGWMSMARRVTRCNVMWRGWVVFWFARGVSAGIASIGRIVQVCLRPMHAQLLCLAPFPGRK